MMDSTNVTEHGNDLYCKSCYGKKFGPKGDAFRSTDLDIDVQFSARIVAHEAFYRTGYGYGQGAGVLNMDDGTGYIVS